MRQIVDRLLVISAGWSINLLAGLALAMVLSRRIGPHGYAIFALYGSLVGLAWIIAGMGVPTALTRVGASFVLNHQHDQWADTRWAGYGLAIATAAGVSVILVLLRSTVLNWFFGFTPSYATVALLAAATICGVVAQVQNSVLKTEGHVPGLVSAHVIAVLAIAAVTMGVVYCFGIPGVIWAVGGGAAVNAVILTGAVKKYGSRLNAVTRRVTTRARELALFGGPFSGGMLAGKGASYLIPVIILHTLDRSSVAFFSVAVTVLESYLGFLTGAVGIDYYPRIASSQAGTPEFSKAVAQQVRLLVIISTPVLVMVMAVAPLVIPALYTAKFEPVVVLLSWMLFGDIFRVGAMPFSYALLAKGRTAIYVATDVARGALTLGWIYLGAHFGGFVGLGAGFVAAQISYFLLTVTVTRYHLGLSSNRLVAIRWVVSLCIVGVALAICLASDSPMIRVYLLAVLGTLTALHSLRELSTMRNQPLPA